MDEFKGMQHNNLLLRSQGEVEDHNRFPEILYGLPWGVQILMLLTQDFCKEPNDCLFFLFTEYFR